MHRKMFAKPSSLIVVVASLLATLCSPFSVANVIKESVPATSSPTLSSPASASSSTSAGASEAVTLSQHGLSHEIKSDLIGHSTAAPVTVTSSHLSTTSLPTAHELGETVHHEAASSSAAASSAASAVLEGHKAMTTEQPSVTSNDHLMAPIKHHNESVTSTANLSSHKPSMTTTAPSESHTASAVHDSIAKVASSLAANATLHSTTMSPSATHHQLDTAKLSAASSLNNSSIKTSATHHEQTTNSSETASASEAKAPLSKFCDYMKPICASLDKILPKQLFKIQSQLKQFVQMSNGKLSMCFLEHYELDPNLKEVSKDDLNRICQSKDVPAGKKGSIKDFESCAAKNWESAIDKEIDRINAARINCIKNHNHTSTNGTTAVNITTASGEAHANLENEEDEASLINEVVSKMLDDEKGTLSKNTDINVIDMSSKSNSSSSSSASSSSRSSLGASSSSISSAKAKGILNDPNTVVVFVDDSTSTKSTTKAPLSVANKQMSSINVKDAMTPHHSTINPTTSVTELKESKAMSKSQAQSEASSSVKSVITQMTTTLKPLASLVTKKMEVAKKVESKLLGTTMAPSTVEKKVISKTMPTSTFIKATTLKPLETLEEMLKRQEREKIEFESRLRMEREKVFRQMQRRQDELDAQNAIKALQFQRQASSSFARDHHDSDEHMHKLEHERQMSIDPIGHTIKHQQYELSKQQKMLG